MFLNVNTFWVKGWLGLLGQSVYWPFIMEQKFLFLQRRFFEGEIIYSSSTIFVMFGVIEITSYEQWDGHVPLHFLDISICQWFLWYYTLGLLSVTGSQPEKFLLFRIIGRKMIFSLLFGERCINVLKWCVREVKIYFLSNPHI